MTTSCAVGLTGHGLVVTGLDPSDVTQVKILQVSDVGGGIGSQGIPVVIVSGAGRTAILLSGWTSAPPVIRW
ncbi:MAG: hypothetical protein OXC82_00655 [Rhodobacteraceae bacterium]|nr:hypothetical protein [Paracoccaceae bacterium]MCY4248937.1 hypothetical protein [Paracoccaceae bacterium]